MSTRIGVDVGGTFTDLIFFDGETGQITVGKGPSNPRDVDLAVRSVVTGTLAPDAASRTELFLHGTTVGLNALLERKGARVGLLTTDGFRDILEQARMERLDERGHRIWDHLFRTPPPLVDRPLRVGVRERILADGSVHVVLDPDSVREAVEIFTREGVECVAIVFINAHANAAHELRAEELLREYGFTGAVSLSHQTTGQYREYERTSTTVIDAYVRPAVAGYLERLQDGLREDAVDGECLITTSAGGCIAFGEARTRPFETVMSGPVAGAVGASTLCRTLGLEMAITADVGGTSFDTCLLVDGRPTVKYEGEVVGMPLQTPWVDVRSVGAGGGSIAYLDNGLLSVGPRSAGAVPGPVAYGRGGTEPTVTDAAATLGMFARSTLASGLELDIEGARSSLTGLADELDLEADGVAQGVIRIAAATMAGAMRAVSIEVGQDPRNGALIAYGGAGPLFGSLLARELQIRTLVVPNYAGQLLGLGAARAGHGPLGRTDDHRPARHRRHRGGPEHARLAVRAAGSAGGEARRRNDHAGGGVRPALPGPGVLVGPAGPDRGRKGRRAARSDRPPLRDRLRAQLRTLIRGRRDDRVGPCDRAHGAPPSGRSVG